MTSQTPFWPWLVAAAFAGWLVWPSAFNAAATLGTFEYRIFDRHIFEEYLLTFLKTVVLMLGPFAIFWALCSALRKLAKIWRLRISIQFMIAALLTIAALVVLNKVGLYDVTGVDGWLFVQVLAFLPATILGGIFGGIALFILRRIRARHLLTFAGVGFGVGLTLVILVSIPSIFSTTSIREKVQNVLKGGGFWAVGGALALTLVWFWWQSLEILRSNDRPDIR
jgi:hypothetical protein